MYGGVIKVHNMFEVNNKAPVCLKKTVFGKLFQPVIHIMNQSPAGQYVQLLFAPELLWQ